MVLLLWLQVPPLVAFGLAAGYGLGHALLDVAGVVTLAAIALVARLPRRGREAAVTLGLLTCSAVLVHLWHGTTEAHFHYFVIVCVLALYEEWFPYLLALGYVVLQHGVMGTIDPDSVYAHPGNAIQSPWVWAAIHGGFIGAMAVASLVSWRLNEQVRDQLRHNEIQLTFQANHDALTDLPNRGRFEARLSDAIRRCARTGRGVAVVFADVDNFKVINDSLGHQSGDELLQAVAQRLAGVLRPQDVLSRFGGDELTAYVEGIDGEEEALAVAHRMAAAMRAPFMLGGVPRFLTASFGIAVTRDPAADPRALLRDADSAMYRAKERGKSRCELFDASMHRDAVERLELENGLRDALARAELRLEYQPEVCLRSGRVVAVEALLRWDHPQLGAISPARFVPIAEQTGLIVAIGAWVLCEACAQAAAWSRTTGTQVTVAVNLSPRQFGASDLGAVVRRALRDAALPPERLCLEITESAVMADPETAIDTLRTLKRVGVQLAIDDFGVGYSSLSHLRDLLPVDVLKVDRSFVERLGARAEDRAIVTAVVEMARALGLTTVAEGVEEPEQAALLAELGCDLAQGFHFARPQRPASVERLLGAEGAGELAA